MSEPYAPSDVSGKPVVYGNACSLEEVVAAFDDLLLMPDKGAVYVALAGVVANYAEGDVVWSLLVGPSGCGKSELITAVTGAPGVWPLSSLTPQTLISGFERKGEPASLLLQIGAFEILAFKDLTTVLSMHREARAQVIGQLREVADGKTEKSFGNGLRLEWQGKLGFIAGVTPIIDEQHAFISVMGERFLLYRLPEVPRAEIARRSLARRGREPELRQRIRNTVGDFLEQFVGCGVLELPPSMTEHLVVLSDMVTRARSGVPRDYNGNLSFIPEPEAPTRLAKQLAQLGAALLAIGVDERETWRLIRKAGWDSVPAVRCAVLDTLAKQSKPVPMSTVQEETGLPERTAPRVVEDVVVLGLAKREKESGKVPQRQAAVGRSLWPTAACGHSAPARRRVRGQGNRGLRCRNRQSRRFAAPCDLLDGQAGGARGLQPGRTGGTAEGAEAKLADPRTRGSRQDRQRIHRRAGASRLPDARAHRPASLGAPAAALARHRLARRRPPRGCLEERGGGALDRALASPAGRARRALRQDRLQRRGRACLLRPGTGRSSAPRRSKRR